MATNTSPLVYLLPSRIHRGSNPFLMIPRRRLILHRRQILRLHRWHTGHIRSNRRDVTRRQIPQTVLNSLTHWPVRRPPPRGMPRSDVLSNLLRLPVSDARSFIAGNVIRNPPRLFGPRKLLTVIQRKPRIARRMTLTAVSHGLSEIRSAIPLRTLLTVSFKPLVRIERRRPQAHSPTLVIREGER